MASGPWYVGNKLLILRHWKEDPNFLHAASNQIPVWVRLYHVPYAYWTPEGLSYVASGIGKPLFMDSVTAKLEPMPFAWICIEITAGAKLPDSVFATVLDDDSGEETLIEVKVEYQNKPQVCGVCSSFGHSHLKCPTTNFQWVPKSSVLTSSAASGPDPPFAGSPKALPMGDSSAAPPTGAIPKSILKRPSSTSLPKGVPPTPKGGSQLAPPKGRPPVDCTSSPKISPFGSSPKVPLTGSCTLADSHLPKALPLSPNPFSVLAQDREDDWEEDRASEPSDDEPPSWGPLVRRLKSIDEKETRALLCEDMGPPLRVQSKLRKKKKSPKGS